MFYQKYNSPIGIITVICDDEALYRIDFGDTFSDENPNKITMLAVRQLDDYFCGKRKKFDIIVKLKGSEFQIKVWNELKKIRYGEVCTYGDIAERIGNKKACRAVGCANKKNPVPIIVPCHRVIASDGIGGYAEGIDKKLVLLNLEKENSDTV